VSKWIVDPDAPIAPVTSMEEYKKNFKEQRAGQVYTHTQNCATEGQKFFLRVDGSIECSECKQILTTIVWAEVLPS
jgi:hypothetical protein